MLEVDLHDAFADFELEARFRATTRRLALCGDSGAGKTTILDAIAGLRRPRRGRIVLDGETLLDTARAIDVPAHRRRLGYVFQDGRLFPHMSVRANLLYGAGGATSGLDAVVALLDLGALLARRPATLSGGERQRVAIGRALLSRPRALLLDEPLTGLHAQARTQVLAYLRRLHDELDVLTVLVTHHAAEVAALADEIVRVDAGRACGTCAADDALHATGDGVR